MNEITVEDLKRKIEAGDSFTLLDVREPFEIYISNIDTDTVQIPLDDLRGKLSELDKSKETIIMCRSGNRSGTACELLEKVGFSNVYNLKGGINEWAQKIDPSLPQY